MLGRARSTRRHCVEDRSWFVWPRSVPAYVVGGTVLPLGGTPLASVWFAFALHAWELVRWAVLNSNSCNWRKLPESASQWRNRWSTKVPNIWRCSDVSRAFCHKQKETLFDIPTQYEDTVWIQYDNEDRNVTFEWPIFSAN